MTAAVAFFLTLSFMGPGILQRLAIEHELYLRTVPPPCKDRGHTDAIRVSVIANGITYYTVDIAKLTHVDLMRPTSHFWIANNEHAAAVSISLDKEGARWVCLPLTTNGEIHVLNVPDDSTVVVQAFLPEQPLSYHVFLRELEFTCDLWGWHEELPQRGLEPILWIAGYPPSE